MDQFPQQGGRGRGLTKIGGRKWPTRLLRQVWYPMTVATNSRYQKLSIHKAHGILDGSKLKCGFRFNQIWISTYETPKSWFSFGFPFKPTSGCAKRYSLILGVLDHLREMQKQIRRQGPSACKRGAFSLMDGFPTDKAFNSFCTRVLQRYAG